MNSFTRYIGFLIMIFLSIPSQGHEKQWPEKRLRQVWGQAQKFTSRQMTLDGGQISRIASQGIKIGSEDGTPTFYFAQDEAPGSAQMKTVGVILFADSFGENGKIEVSVAMDPDGRIKKVDIWDHSENPGIAQDEFLAQFKGKSAKDSLKEGNDIKPVKGAIKASEAVTEGVERALKITKIAFERKSEK